MSRLYHHPKLLMVIATAVACAGVVVPALHASWVDQLHVWAHLRYGWLALSLLGAVLAIPAYLLCYAAMLRCGPGPKLPNGLIARIVAVGFGPFVPGGGFSADRKALAALNDDPGVSVVTVSAIGLLEMAVICPPIGVVAVWLLGNHEPSSIVSGLMWWVYGVPIGFAIAFAAMFWAHLGRPHRSLEGWRGAVLRMPMGGLALLSMLRRPKLASAAIIGMAAYWALDFLCFWAAVRCAHSHIDVRLVLVVYGSGYMLTRRSSPLGGAGVTEIFMILALNWAGVPLSESVVAVVLYRIFNFLFPAVPALLARARVEPLIEAGAGEFAHDPLYMSAEEALIEASGVGEADGVEMAEAAAVPAPPAAPAAASVSEDSAAHSDGTLGDGFNVLPGRLSTS